MYGITNHNYLKILERSDGFVDIPASLRKGKLKQIIVIEKIHEKQTPCNWFRLSEKKSSSSIEENYFFLYT